MAEKRAGLRPMQSWLAASGFWLLWAYVLAVFIGGQTIAGVSMRLPHWWLMAALSYATIYWGVRWSQKRRLLSWRRLKGAAVASVIALAAILSVDNGYAFLDELRSGPGPGPNLGCVNDDELLPRPVYPTEKSFVVYSPAPVVTGKTCGHWATNALAASPTLMQSVFEARDQVYVVDAHGFRETTPLEQARVFALGDSFVFGQGTRQDLTWPEVLDRLTDRPVYNLGTAGSGPKQQVMLLEHLLRTQAGSVKIEHLLWMVFEGNDLEDSYEAARAEREAPGQTYSQDNAATLAEALYGIPERVKQGSVINRLMTGSLKLGAPRGSGLYAVDGVSLNVPLHHSDRYGYRLFWPPGISRVRESRDYVVYHPNRPLLDQAFSEMEALREEHGFDVTVMVAPTAARLYSQYYDGLEAASAKPHFADYVEGLSGRRGFGFVPLLQLMEPYAAEELLYWRDDPHWNERGNALVAEIIAERVFGTCAKPVEPPLSVRPEPVEEPAMSTSKGPLARHQLQDRRTPLRLS